MSRWIPRNGSWVSTYCHARNNLKDLEKKRQRFMLNISEAERCGCEGLGTVKVYSTIMNEATVSTLKPYSAHGECRGFTGKRITRELLCKKPKPVGVESEFLFASQQEVGGPANQVGKKKSQLVVGHLETHSLAGLVEEIAARRRSAMYREKRDGPAQSSTLLSQSELTTARGSYYLRSVG